MYNRKGNILIDSCIFEENSSSIHGGAIYSLTGNPIITNSQFNRNTAGASGGAIYSSGSDGVISRTIFFTNGTDTTSISTLYEGGAIAISGGRPTISSCVFERNYSILGGGISNDFGSPTISNSIFLKNEVLINGAGIFSENSSNAVFPIVVNGCSFVDNYAITSAGAIYFYNFGKAELRNSIFYNNRAHPSSRQSLWASASFSNSYNNGMDKDKTYLPTNLVDLAGKYYKDLFVDSTNFKGADSTWLTKDDAFVLTSGSPLSATGNSSLGTEKDVTGYYRSSNPSIGPYENYNCSGSHKIPSQPDSTYTSAIKTTDTANWSHYCTSNGELLLSLFLSSGNAVVDSNQVRLKLGESTTYSTSNYGSFITNTDGYAMIDRRWDVGPSTNNSSDSVGVRYYFTDAEYNDVVSALGSKSTTISAVTDLQMYKLTSGGAFATPHEESGFIIFNDTISSNNKWKYSAHNSSNHRAEFAVSSFSGGGGGASGGGGGALPVELITFEVFKKDQSNAMLQWQTALEIDNKLFEIQRLKKDGHMFEKRGEILGTGNSNTLQNYSFVDDISGINSRICYRLKQIDFNGEHEYSEVKCISNPIQKNKILFYPNPSSGSISFDIPEAGAEYSVRIVSVYGQVIQEHLIVSNSAIDVHSLSTGSYMIEFYEDSNLLSVQKMVINH
jgi:predicted outer membrane repeat protein